MRTETGALPEKGAKDRGAIGKRVILGFEWGGGPCMKGGGIVYENEE